MKAEINANGVLILTPKNVTEGFAIKAWFDRSIINTQDLARIETHYHKGSSIEAYFVKVKDE